MSGGLGASTEDHEIQTLLSSLPGDGQLLCCFFNIHQPVVSRLVLLMLRTLILLIYIALCLIFVLPGLILWSVLTKSPDFMYGMAMQAVRFANRLCGIRVRVEGLDNIPPGVCIFAANHVSNVDPLAFVPSIPRRVSILIKKELFRIPILSIGMRLAGFIPVDRSDRGDAAASADAAVRHLHEGLSFAIFAEGTRSPDGRLRRFKKGAFVIAMQARVPVVPVSLVGTRQVMRKGETAIHPGEVIVRFGPAVETSRYTTDRRAELQARVESLVAAGLPPDQQPLPRTPNASS
jgi:1-acyl-sn-glycerol-3-phosphate acyltransferase